MIILYEKNEEAGGKAYFWVQTSVLSMLSLRCRMGMLVAMLYTSVLSSVKTKVRDGDRGLGVFGIYITYEAKCLEETT